MEERMKNLKLIAAISSVFLMSLVSAGTPETKEATKSILFTNISVFNGKDNKLLDDVDVLVKGNKISKIGKNLKTEKGTEVINSQGHVMMPGLIDAHWHSIWATISQAKLLQSDFAYTTLLGAKANEDALQRGFTTVRDTGGNVFPIQKATDEGLVAGPRIYPSGALITQTSGHGDFRGPLDVPTNDNTPLDYHQRTGNTLIADGVPEVMKRTREVLRMGASQIKVMAGGGVSSLYDPIDVVQYTFEEMKAIVDVAKTWNTYVTIHANNDASVQMAIKAGVKCVEHGFLLSEDTIKLMAKEGVWLSVQPILDDEDAIPFPDPVSRKKFVEVTNGTNKIMNLAKKHKVKMAFGTDTLFDPELAKKQGKMLTKMTKWLSPYETLKMATSTNAKLLKLSGPRDPYPGKLGVIEEGAFADLILVKGNPLQNISLITDPQNNFSVIMKDGKIYKNTIIKRTMQAQEE